jgi:hypothetical protein
MRSSGRDERAAEPLEAVDRRIAGLKNWLIENAPYCAADQAHLNENGVERAYWHFGYLAALKDVRRILSEADD